MFNLITKDEDTIINESFTSLILCNQLNSVFYFLFRQNFNGTGTMTGTKLASIILHGTFLTTAWTVPVPVPIVHCIGPSPVKALTEQAIKPLNLMSTNF